MSFSHSSTECFQNCPAQYKFRYVDNTKMIPSDDPASALYLGTALHRGIETDVETAIREYFETFPIITDAHINESIKLEHWIPIVKGLLPEGHHEVELQDEHFHGFLDLICPCTKLDDELPHGQYDLYDFKYSNNVEHYMESRQLHLYKYKFEKLTGKRIRKMFFVFVPKVNIKQKKTEDLHQFRQRIKDELKDLKVEIKEVTYDPNKVLEYFELCQDIQHTTEFPRNESFLCKFCEYQDLCIRKDDTMQLPSTERRQVGKTTKRKLWIYGSAFSGKTTFMDKAPNPLNLNTDGNIQFVTMPTVPIKDTYEGRQKVLAWEVFKSYIDELEKGNNDFNTIIVDLLEDSYESCRLYMYQKLGIEHESDDSFRAWDKVRTEFLSTIRRLMGLDYENIVLISHEDTSKDITKKTGDKITAIKPNIQDKIANKIAGMVDIVARVVVEDDDSRTLNFKSNEVIFGGGRLKGITKTSIPLDWDALCAVYDEANSGRKTLETPKVNNSTPEPAKADSEASDEAETRSERKTRRTSRRPDHVQDILLTDNIRLTKDNEVLEFIAGQNTISQMQEYVNDGWTVVEEGGIVPQSEPNAESDTPARTRRTRKTR